MVPTGDTLTFYGDHLEEVISNSKKARKSYSLIKNFGRDVQTQGHAQQYRPRMPFFE